MNNYVEMIWMRKMNIERITEHELTQIPSEN